MDAPPARPLRISATRSQYSRGVAASPTLASSSAIGMRQYYVKHRPQATMLRCCSTVLLDVSAGRVLANCSGIPARIHGISGKHPCEIRAPEQPLADLGDQIAEGRGHRHVAAFKS